MGLLDNLFGKKPAQAPKTPPRPMMRPGMGGPRPAPKAEKNFMIIILDSLRWVHSFPTRRSSDHRKSVV